MLIRSNIWIRLKHISSTLSTSQGPFLTNWRWAPSSVWSPHFDLHVTFTFSFWGLIANNFFVLLHESHFHSLFLRTYCNFLGPRGPLIEPSPVRPSVHPSATIFPKFIDELKDCRQASGTPQTIYFLNADDVSYPNLDKNSNTETNMYKDKYRDKYKDRDI